MALLAPAPKRGQLGNLEVPKRTPHFNLQSLDTTDTTFEKNEELSIIRNIYLPEKASDLERRIHKYLDQKYIFQVNAKMMMEEDNKNECKSPALANHFKNK